MENENNQDLAQSLVGKLLSVRSYNFDAMKRTLNQIWSISNGALFRVIENGLFVVQFANQRDKAKVMAGRPWTFDQHLVLLNEIDGDQQPSNITLKFCPFWVRLYNLPLGSRLERHVRQIGGCLGEVLEVENDGVRWDKSVRARILLDVTLTLRRVQRISLKNGNSTMVEIKYERLPTFCYVCGTIGHIERDCMMPQDEEKDIEKQWGSWLRASPRKGRLKMEDEARQFLRCAKSLDFASLRKGRQEATPSSVSTEMSEENGPVISTVKEPNLVCISGSVGEKSLVTQEVVVPFCAVANGPAARVEVCSTVLGATELGDANPKMDDSFPKESAPPGNFIPHMTNDPPLFAFNAISKQVVPKTRNHKVKSRVVPMEINEAEGSINNAVNDLCLGEKRKLPDMMLVNDETGTELQNPKKTKKCA